MAGSGDAPRVVRFGDFAFDSRSLELRKAHRIVRLQERPARALALLLSRPGEVVTRDELCKELWPAGTFVDFDNSLNNVISRLRSALGDDVDRPRFVATVGRRGYRFVADLVEEPTAAATLLDEEQRSQARNGDATSPEPLTGGSSPSTAPETRSGVSVGRVMLVGVTVAAGFAALAAVLQVGWQRNPDLRAQHALRDKPGVAVAATGGADAGPGEARPTLTRAPEVVLVEVTTLTEKGLLEDAYRGVLRAGAELPASPAVSFARAYVLDVHRSPRPGVLCAR